MRARFITRAIVATVLIRGGVGGGEVAGAQPRAQANLKVSAEVVQNCAVTTTDVLFGAYDPIGANSTAPLDATGTIQLTCTQGTVAIVGLDNGQNASGSSRRMANGPSRLAYELYQDAGRTQPWRTNAEALKPPAATSMAPRSFTVYGRVTQAQDVPAGSYNDIVLVTVTF